MNKKLILTTLLLTLICNYSFCQYSAFGNNTKKDKSSKKEIKSLDEFTKKTKDCNIYDGLFTIYQSKKDGKSYIEIDSSHLNQEFIYFSYIENGVTDAGAVKGSYRGSKIIKINKFYNKIDFTIKNTTYYFDDESPLKNAENTNINTPLIISETIIATSSDKTKFLLNADNIFLNESFQQVKYSYPGSYRGFKLGNLSKNKTRYNKIRNYPENTDIVVNYFYESKYPSSRGGGAITDSRNVSVLVQHSLVKMPDENFKPRKDDSRVGFFTTKSNNMTSIDQVNYRDFINKWRLVKKDTSKLLSEPVKPIVWWIENTTPLEFRDIIKEGVERWNLAFEKAGFLNAVQVKVQPDSADWDAGDIRYNVLRWTSSPNPPWGGYGPSFVNPRTGEILGADIMLEWSYTTNRIVADELFNESNHSHDHLCSAAKVQQIESSFGINYIKNMNLSDELEKELVKQSIYRLVLHEVGHTLGLNHNFKGSYLNSNADIHNKTITQDKGLTNSVMEYPAVNIAPLGIEQGDYYDTKPGLYDDWAIEFGYKPNLSKNDLDKLLSKSDMPELMFANDSEDMRSVGNGIDPRAMIYDLTNEPITYGEQRIELVNQIISTLPERLDKKVDSWEEYRNAYSLLLRETEKALIIASRHIGGVHVNRSSPQQESSLKPYEPVPYDIQKQAMSMLSKHAFSPEAFPINKDLLNIVQVQRRGFDLRGEGEDPKLLQRILSIQNDILRQLLHPNVLERITNSTLYGNSYSVNELIADLNQSVFFSDINTEVSYARQNLQITYVKKLLKIVNNNLHDEISTSTAYSALRDIEKIMKKSSRDEATKSHRLFVRWLIDSELTKL